ncbi:MAG: GNAT family N-acetyltransferase [Gemmatimonadaceae bacterium]
MNDIEIVERAALSDDALNDLFALTWPAHVRRDFARVLQHSLTYFAAFEAQQLVGFVNLAWDGGSHAFVLDPTVHPRSQRQGLGSLLVRRALVAASEGGVEWVHVDYAPHLASFYAALGFRITTAGVLRVRVAQ